MPGYIKKDPLVVQKGSSNSALLVWRVRMQSGLLKPMLGWKPGLTGVKSCQHLLPSLPLIHTPSSVSFFSVHGVLSLPYFCFILLWVSLLSVPLLACPWPIRDTPNESPMSYIHSILLLGLIYLRKWVLVFYIPIQKKRTDWLSPRPSIHSCSNQLLPQEGGFKGQV